MTIPIERTASVLRARDLLTELSTVPDDADLEVLRERARRLLRHYPEFLHLQSSSAMAPEIWGDPGAKW
ncbi:BPSL0761 family protein [Paraburkholderia sp. GAS42]|uniref:BPSL0761 family protein n=1 Tax=Paraburkholderia sp. GAS42 TaxID=3035135 RepID=UPI003D217545